jgi:hypothetical protein
MIIGTQNKQDVKSRQGVRLALKVCRIVSVIAVIGVICFYWYYLNRQVECQDMLMRQSVNIVSITIIIVIFCFILSNVVCSGSTSRGRKVTVILNTISLIIGIGVLIFITQVYSRHKE